MVRCGEETITRLWKFAATSVVSVAIEVKLVRNSDSGKVCGSALNEKRLDEDLISSSLSD